LNWFSFGFTIAVFYSMILKQSIALAVVLFWCVMNLLLIKRQLWAPSSPVFVSGAGAIREASQEWWGIYYGGEKIGFTSQTIEPNHDGYLLRDDSLLRLNLLGMTQRASTRLTMRVDKEWVLKDFDFELRSNDIHFKSRGKIVPGKLHLEIESAEHTSHQQIALTQPPYLAAALKPLIATQQLEEGKEHFFTIFDPATLAQQTTSIVIEAREQIMIGDKTAPAIRLRQRFKGLSVVSWVDGQGRTLKEESPGGFVLRREAPQQAKSFAEVRAVPLDLISRAAIAVGQTIAEPQNSRTLRLKLTGVNMANFVLAQGRQKFSENELRVEREIVSPSDTYKIPLQDRRFGSFLQPTAFLQSDHPRIRDYARQILGNETDAYRAVLRLKAAVYNEIEKQPTISIPNALEVLHTRKGDCNEHTVLFNALARAVGIPAKTAVGMVYLRGAFYYHAWSEVWLGKWITVDSVLDQFPADVTHIKFVEGEIDRQVDILQLVGSLKIEVLQQE
jgi:Transglutaminase-like superfamily